MYICIYTYMYVHTDLSKETWRLESELEKFPHNPAHKVNRFFILLFKVQVSG